MAVPKKISDQVTERATGRDTKTGQVLSLVKSQPAQLALFQTFFPDDSSHYSNTIELYDAIPKYFASHKRMSEQRTGGIYLKSLQRRFRHSNQWYDLVVTPARIIDKHGDEKEYYPTSREELVEEALKKIACDRVNGIFLDETVGVQFTLYELDKELKSQGHAIRWPELITSLQICRHAGVLLKGPHGKVEVDSPIFPVMLLRNREEWRENPKNVYCYVQFNPLVTYSIHKMTYRQFDYVTFMKLTKPLSRYLFKRLSHNYRQASMTEPYKIKHSTIVRDSALVNAARIQDQIRDVCQALSELSGEPSKKTRKKLTADKVNVLNHYEMDETRGARNKILDVTYTLYPHPNFIAEVKKANSRKIENESRAFQSRIYSEGELGTRRRQESAGDGAPSSIHNERQ